MLAVDDLDELAAYIAKDKPAAAIRFLESAEQTFQVLAQTPEHGALLETTRAEVQGIRLWHISGFPKYLILYRPITEGVEILRVFYGTRNWESLL